MEKVKIDQTVGLLVLLAALVALAVFSASLPAMAGYQAEQNASVSKATAIEIRAQNNVTTVNYWNFTGTVGAYNVTPVNDAGDVQDKDDPTKPIARLNNTNADLNLTVYLNAGSFGNVVKTEYWNVSDISIASGDQFTAFTFDTDTPTDQIILKNYGLKNLWLRVLLNQSGTGTSTFKVLGEAT